MGREITAARRAALFHHFFNHENEEIKNAKTQEQKLLSIGQLIQNEGTSYRMFKHSQNGCSGIVADLKKVTRLAVMEPRCQPFWITPLTGGLILPLLGTSV